MEDIINELSSLIYHIARKFTSDNDLINELYNQGVLGVYDAYSKYNKDSNTKFSSYAYMYIYGKMYLYLNENRNIKLNKDTIKLYKLIMKTKDYLSQINYREATNKEIANYMNVDVQVIESTLNMISSTLSLDYEYEEGSMSSFVYQSYDIDKVEINDLLSSLSEEEKKIIMYKYYSGYSQSEIAKIMNMSQSGVSRSEKKSIERMRERLRV